MATAPQQLSRARDAMSRHAWREALDLLAEADAADDLGPEDLEALGEAAWWMGRLDLAIEARERAYAAYRKSGDAVAAARAALRLCRDHGMRGDAAMHTGWFRRAERVLEGQPESASHGLLEQRRASEALHAGDVDAALSHGRECEAIGVRLGDPNLQALGLHLQGMALVQRGDVEPGLALLDEAIVAAVSGELDPDPTGVIYCNAINVCRDLADYGRAGEWTEAAKRWCERMAVSGFPGICRVRRAEITRLRGAWAEAEREARRAVDELRDWYVDVAAEGLYEIGEIRLRLGDLPAAEEAFQQANELGLDPQPGLALLRLREGNVHAAATAIRRSLSGQGGDRLARARLLPTQVEIACAAGDLETARAAVEELVAITRTYTAMALRAETAVARGRLLLSEGHAERAAEALRDGRRLWTEADAPYEAAMARVLLGLAYREAGDEEGARMELEAARAGFDLVGAAPDLARVHELLGGPGPRAASVAATRTFMFTDIVGSTPLVEAIGDEAWSDLVRWHDQSLRACFAEHGGQEVDHAGDGFFVAFPEPDAAFDCAVTIQRRLGEHRRIHGFAPRVRVGLHTAEAAREGGAYRGRGVHTAARIAALADGGEILASRESLPSRVSYPLSEPRPVTLKGLSRPVEVVSVVWRP